MKIYHFLTLMLALASAALFAGCSDSDDDGMLPMASSVVSIAMPDGLDNPKVENMIVSLKDIATGKSAEVVPGGSAVGDFSATMASNDITLSMPEGLYNISICADITYTVDGEQMESELRGVAENVTVSRLTSAKPIIINSYLYNPSSAGNGFVFAELFYAKTLTPEGKQYAEDSYFVIYNNSADTLYADGLVIAESTFQSDVKEDYEPNIISEAVTISTAYRIPGSGRDVPVAPGESLLIADAGIDHRPANPNSFDLSKADFEWYDESSDPDYTDVDSDVPNLETILNPSLTVWTPHMRGVRSYILCYLGGDKDKQMPAEEYASNYHYIYTYNFVWDGEVYPMGDFDGYKIPNSWVIDCVNTACLDDVQWMVTDPSLDRGYTYTRETYDDATSYGQCVRRKHLSGIYLMDTNDSSHDFEPKQTANPFYKFH